MSDRQVNIAEIDARTG